MGIRGAWSLLSNDPRRFGRPWSVSTASSITTEVMVGADHEDTSLVFLDGPSLLYHVAVSEEYDQFPPIATLLALNQKQRRYEQTSPATIYARIQNFILALLETIGPESVVHVVMDGLAPAAKLSTQVSRLRKTSRQCDMQAPQGTSRYKILHILAEPAMMEALDDLQKSHSERLHIHRPSHGEAEAYIDAWLRLHAPKPFAQVAILSDDTDFLVYPSCPGFIPFRTLAFQQMLNGQLCLVGFQYLRSKFISAFLSNDTVVDDNTLVLTTVAALAGCDYAPSVVPVGHTLFDAARTFIVHSQIGGLRQKQRNDPTMAAALTAILRFVSHYRKKDPNDWIHSMALAIFPNAPKASGFVAVCQEIHSVYFESCPIEPKESHHAFQTLSVEGRRLLEYGILFCRPVIETWEGGSCSTKRATSSRQLNRKGGKKQRKNRPYQAKELDQIMVEDHATEDVTQDMPPLSRTIDAWVGNASGWTLPHLCQFRTRLYSLLRRYFLTQCNQEAREMTCHERWSTSIPSIQEYRRIGRGQSVDFSPATVSVPVFASDLPLSTLQAGLICTMGHNDIQDIGDGTNSMLENHGVLFLASLMLPPMTAQLLILLGTVPPVIPVGTWQSDVLEMSLKQSLDFHILLSTLACFHADLFQNVWSSVVVDAATPTRRFGKLRVSHVFRNDVATWIWARLHECAGDEEHTSIQSFFVNGTFPVSDGSEWNSQTVQSWQDSASQVWDLWWTCFQQTVP